MYSSVFRPFSLLSNCDRGQAVLQKKMSLFPEGCRKPGPVLQNASQRRVQRDKMLGPQKRKERVVLEEGLKQ
jgi:hypothetical protein